MTMTLDSLEKCGDDELRGVIARCEELLADHDRRRKAAALEQAARNPLWRLH